MTGAPMSKLEGDLAIVRVFDAPPTLVFKAWTDPKMLTRWWGPRMVTHSTCEMDVRVGGNLRIVMHGPNGAKYPMKGVFKEIVAPERLVFTSIAVDEKENHLLEGETRVTFEEVDGGKTKMTLYTKVVGKVPQAEFMIGGMKQGWTESIDKLGELLAQS